MSTPVARSLDPTPGLPPHVTRVYGEPRFHTDGDVAALAFAADGTVRAVDDGGVLWHWAGDGRPLARHYLSDLETLWCFGPGAVLLASGNDDLIVWDAAAGQLLHRIPLPSWVTAVAFSPDGRTLASGHDDGRVRFWDAATRRPLGEVAAHRGPVSAVSFAPAGDRLATAGEDRVVRAWDAVTHKPAGELVSHTDRIPALVWRPDGALLVSAGWDTSARVWRPPQPDPLMLLNTHADQVLAVAFSPDGRLLATADSDYDVHLWADPAAGEVAHVLRGHTDEVRCLAFSPDGAKLATGGADRVVHVWEVGGGRLVAGPNPKGRHAVAVIPGRPLRLASTAAPALRVWDADTGAEVAPTGLGPAFAVAAGADGKWLAAGGADHVTRLWDAAAGQPGPALEATKPPVGAVAFSADGRRLAQTSPADGLVWVWDCGTGQPELILIEAADGCTLEGVAFHPNGRWVACGGVDYLSTGERDGAVCVWDLPTKEKKWVLDVGVYALAFDPPGKYLAGAGLDNLVYMWDVDTEETIFALAGHRDRVTAVGFSPCGSYLVSGGDDATLRVWDVLSGRLLAVRELDAAVQSVAFAPDGKDLFCGNGNTTCYRLDFTGLLED